MSINNEDLRVRVSHGVTVNHKVMLTNEKLESEVVQMKQYDEVLHLDSALKSCMLVENTGHFGISQ